MNLTTYLFKEIISNTYFQITCTKTTTHIAIHNKKRITLKARYQIKTATTLTTMGHNLYTDQDIIAWPFNWNISHTMFDMSLQHLEEVIKSLNLIHYPSTPIRDIHQIIHSPHTITIWITIVIPIIFVDDCTGLHVQEYFIFFMKYEPRMAWLSQSSIMEKF